ncbi:uncharacterized protein TNCV_2916261 [Trichonephila clavipes]|nr:uncharacterized protein TNCV_2916261 [Trichonephila clavipes]
MSPIEPLGDLIGRRLTRDPRPAASKDELLLRIQAIWNSLPQADIQNLFNSMPRRMAALIAAHMVATPNTDFGHFFPPGHVHVIYISLEPQQVDNGVGDKHSVDTRRYPRAENRAGATRKTTRREDRRIVRQALVDPTVTRSTIRADVGVAIVPQTISRHLAEANLKSKRPFRAPPFNTGTSAKWCKARSMWNVTDWKQVVFSDESRFVLGTDDNRVRVWSRPGERYNSLTLFYVTLPAQLV